VRKTFTLPKADAPEEYVAHLDLTFENTGAAAVPVPAQFLYAGSAAALHSRDRADYTGFGWSQDNGKFTFKNSSSGFGSGGLLGFGRTDTPTIVETGSTDWACVTSQYFATILTAQADSKAAGIWTHRFPVDVNQLAGNGPVTSIDPSSGTRQAIYAVEGALTLPAFSLEAGKPKTFHYDLYTGPRELDRLKGLGQGQDAALDFGKLSIVSKTLLASMNWLHGRLGSYAAAIIVLTLIIRGLMWTLQNKATQSMKKMQALQPEMTRLKEKYQDDPQRMNQELMKLYRTYGVNPVAGCLPMVIQIPVFFGFYNMLGRAVELRNSHFLWVHDLSQPDTVAMIGGYPLNVLPLLMAVTMLGQMSLSPKSGDAVQQRMMMFMPLAFIAFCYNYASGLALYFTVSNLFSIAQLYVTRNQTTPVLQKLPAPAKKKRN
jgi:YidC/Oxa1 family membrane protein insertase